VRRSSYKAKDKFPTLKVRSAILKKGKFMERGRLGIQFMVTVVDDGYDVKTLYPVEKFVPVVGNKTAEPPL
jgi:hypothetical protein